MVVEFLPTSGAAQEKQSAAALPSSNPKRPPFVLCLAFLAAGQDGRCPKNWLSGIPAGLPGLESLTP